ncbi:hypothetical protein OG585_27545 [Streptomyces sp. NBC_01340]|uniref:hypothetical protein n=1 Tax=unclassified Streptomyces TaxID=2593676 RepID=UPI0022599091|nr:MULTISPECIES: hypothetical protein [unclassified Streptomyces]MCX4456337.1 hypothetical protein [Streptomyces sp. NBC_01719]MCX4495695.1 hypothetical protein [Streptomyces sp. NBC_01728]WSI40648.1 hypothetical protein OG585_27545 [Streptomyces sp. NBC_01340]
MGERHGDGGTPDRRVAHPSSSPSEEPAVKVPRAAAPRTPASEVPSLEVLLAAAVRGRPDDAEAEAQAVAAFRVARDNGAHAARTRRRDDWRPREQRRVRRSLKATFAVLLASVTLGGVAVAAIGSSSSDNDNEDRGGAGNRPTSSAPDRSAQPDAPGVPDSSAPGTSAQADPSGHPTQAQDTEAHCRAYASVKGRGNALNSAAWQRLVTAAGGEDKVAAYCAEQLSDDTGSAKAKKSDGTPSPAATAAATPKPTKSKGKQ